LDVLDVGQGDAFLLRSPEGKSVLIDAGTGRTDIAAELRGRGVEQIDMVVATHPHQDHIGGMEAVLRSMPVGVYLDNGVVHTTQTYENLMKAVTELGLAYQQAEAGQHIKFGKEATIDVLWPGQVKLRGTRSDLNANSIVLRVEHEQNCFLFTGDSEEETETRVMMRGLQPCGVLKVAHHGGNHSTGDRFLSKAQPEIALISVGESNRYGHPGDETLRRLARRKVVVYRTDESGALQVLSTERGIEVLEGIINVESSHVPPPTAYAEQLEEAQADHENDDPGLTFRYVASKKSAVFHSPDCEWAQKISDHNLVGYETYAEAIEDGKRPAGCCNPKPEAGL